MKKKIIIALLVLTTVFLLSSCIKNDNVQRKTSAGSEKACVIILDAGHGGKDAGAAAVHTINGEDKTFTEKEINLKIALKLKEKINKAFPNANIVLTREEDVFIPLEERKEKLDSVHMENNVPVMIISIHTNASVFKNNRGLEFSIADDKNNYKFASEVLQQYLKIFGNELPFSSIKRYNGIVLTDSVIPAITADIGYISNSEDAALLYSEQGLEKCADALFNGIAAYLVSL